MFFAAQSVTAKTNWTDWTKLDRSDFPTRVKAIYFPNGKLTMDADHWITWQKWTVFFGAAAPLPQIDIEWPNDAIIARVKIEVPLRCKHPAVGESDCTMYLYRFYTSGAPPVNQCRVVTMTSPSYKFTIDCPTYLMLGD